MFIPVLPSNGVAGLRYLEETESTQLESVAADPEVARETEYFRDNIAKATTAEGLLADRRLLQVALTAYGLESEIDKTAFIQQVLEGGVSDPSSFANRLNDPRWFDFAQDFGYGDPTSGREVSGFRAAVEVRFMPSGTPDPTADDLNAADLATFRANIDGVTSIDALLADPTTLDTALAAFGLERGYYTDDHFRQLLTEGTELGSYARSLSPGTWVSFANAFQGLGDGRTLEVHSQFEMDVAREMRRFDAPPLASQTAADADPNRVSDAEFATFRIAMDAAATPADALANDVFLKVSRAGFGLGNSTVSDADARALLTAAAAGDLSLAQAQSDAGWLRLAQSFQDAWRDGTKQTVSGQRYDIELAIADNDLETVSYIAPPDDGIPTVDAAELAYFQANVDTKETARQLVADKRLIDVALIAFGLENETLPSDADLERILTEDPADPLAFVNTLDNPIWAEFGDAFQPPSEGDPVQADIWRYGLEERLAAVGAPQEDIDYLRRNWDLIDVNLDVVIDPKLMDIVVSAFGIEKGAFGSNFVLNMLIGDPDDPNTFVNRFGDANWKAFSDFFANRSQSNVKQEEFPDEVIQKYHQNLFEVGVGSQDQSLRVALNFRNEIDEIASGDNVAVSGWLEILASEPLRAVIDGAFALPSQFAQLDLGAQRTVYERRAASVFGGSDPSVFLDPANVTKALDLYLSRTVSQAQPQTPAYLTLLTQTAGFAQSINRTF